MLLTYATFKLKREGFDNASLAMVWLTQRFRSTRADLFEHYVGLKERGILGAGRASHIACTS